MLLMQDGSLSGDLEDVIWFRQDAVLGKTPHWIVQFVLSSNTLAGIMRPAVTFVNYACTLSIIQYFQSCAWFSRDNNISGDIIYMEFIDLISNW